MGRVVDQNALGLRSAALNKLTLVADLAGYAEQRCQGIEGRTRVVLGAGHDAGDRIIAAMPAAEAQLRRAQSAVQAAMTAIKKVDVMRWEPD